MPQVEYIKDLKDNIKNLLDSKEISKDEYQSYLKVIVERDNRITPPEFGMRRSAQKPDTLKETKQTD